MARAKSSLRDHVDLNLSILIIISVVLILGLASLIFGNGLIQASVRRAVPSSSPQVSTRPGVTPRPSVRPTVKPSPLTTSRPIFRAY